MFDMFAARTPRSVEIEPLGFMRGRTFNDTVIVADEMQNSTPNQMKMLLTRVGRNTKLIITGDLSQSDLCSDNGLAFLTDKMNGLDLTYITHVEMDSDDIVRHPCITEILKVLS
jgi:phosphate starvation-inducible PhoH-like protein